MKRIRTSVTGIVFALILAASMLALSAPASADEGGATWEGTSLPELPLGVTWEP